MEIVQDLGSTPGLVTYQLLPLKKKFSVPM